MNVKSVKQKIKTALTSWFDQRGIIRSRNIEIRKFQDHRREAIYSKVQLTDTQKTEIDKIYKENYGETIPYTWHRHFTAYTGRFDPYYFPELLFIPEFERFMNPDKSYTKVFGDKAVLPLIARTNSVDVYIPEMLFTATNGLLRDCNNNIITKEHSIDLLKNRKAFLKPTVGTNSGVGCMLLDSDGDKDKKTGKTIESVLDQLGKNYLAQECIVCHSSIRKIYSESVNTFRIITYIWKENVEHMPVIMRIGQGGSYLDNAHAGGMFIAVSDEGILHKNAFTEFRKVYSEHPDTGLVFDGYRIEHFPKVIEAAKKMHRAIPQIGCINWDFTINEEGIPVLIEGNMRGGSIWLIEMAHGCGGFGQRTPEVLRWLKLCKRLSPADRSKYAYGRMDTDSIDRM